MPTWTKPPSVSQMYAELPVRDSSVLPCLFAERQPFERIWLSLRIRIVFLRTSTYTWAPCSGSVCCWASCIRIRTGNYFVRIRILPSTSKKLIKTLISVVELLINDFLSLKSDVNILTKSNHNKVLRKYFFFGILEVTDKKSRIRIHKSHVKDPDPYQNVTDPEHCTGLQLIDLFVQNQFRPDLC